MTEANVDHWRPWYKVWPPHLAYSLDYPDVPAWWILERNLGRFDSKDAVVFLDYEDMSEISRLTYGELYDGAVALSVSLRDLGVKKGDRIATVLPNSPAIIQSYYGIWLAGATIVPNSPMAKGSELEKTLVSSGVKMVIIAERMFPDLRKACEAHNIQIVVAPVGGSPGGDIPEDVPRFESLLKNEGKPPSDFAVDPKDDIAVILYTGGTTGEPKGAMLTHRNIVANTIQFAEW